MVEGEDVVEDDEEDNEDPEIDEEDEVDVPTDEGDVTTDEGDVTVEEGATVDKGVVDETDTSVSVNVAVVAPPVTTVPEMEMGVVIEELLVATAETDREADTVALGTPLDEAATPLIVNLGLALPESPNTTRRMPLLNMWKLQDKGLE